METPAQKLAAKIAARLVEAGLLTAERGQKIQANLPNGDVKADDWRLEIELSHQDKIPKTTAEAEK
ncbi:MAG: hypothetical protein AAFY72_18560 [Cyanobacteria bacterium J06649_4]